MEIAVALRACLYNTDVVLRYQFHARVCNIKVLWLGSRDMKAVDVVVMRRYQIDLMEGEV